MASVANPYRVPASVVLPSGADISLPAMQIFLIGTAHVSKASAQEVRDTIRCGPMLNALLGSRVLHLIGLCR